jgi:hypothetical protein
LPVIAPHHARQPDHRPGIQHRDQRLDLGGPDRGFSCRVLRACSTRQLNQRFGPLR